MIIINIMTNRQAPNLDSLFNEYYGKISLNSIQDKAIKKILEKN